MQLFLICVTLICYSLNRVLLKWGLSWQRRRERFENVVKYTFLIYVFLSSLRYKIKMNKWHVYNNTRFFAVVPLLLHSQSFTIRENTYMRWWWFFYPSITLSISFMCQVFISFLNVVMAYHFYIVTPFVQQ